MDFAYLKEAFADLGTPSPLFLNHHLSLLLFSTVTTHGPLPQSDFLNRMGIHMRVEMLKQRAESEARKDDMDKAAKRLVNTDGMGSEYMVLAVTSHNGKGEPVWPFVEVENGQER